jgi:Fur family ferric uptake transcriptional regulator
MSVTHADIWSSYAQAALGRAGHRSGGARNAVVQLLGEQDCCLSAQEIFDALRQRKRSVGLASVYRVLELLLSLELVQRVDVGDGVARYEALDPSGHHHHHLLCDRCGRVMAFEDAGLESAIDELSTRLGSEVVRHDVLLHGKCPDCTATAPGD